jgi:O-antigen ligase
MALLTLAGLTAAWIGRKPGGETWRSPLTVPLLAFAALAVVSALWAEYRPAAVDAFLLGAVYIGVYFWTANLTRTRADHRRLVYVILGTAVFISLIGFLKIIGANPFPWWEYGLAGEKNSLAGVFGNRNHLAGFLEMSLPLLYGLLLWKKWSPGPFALWIGIGVFILLAHILSLSRGGWFSLITATAFFIAVLMIRGAFRYKKWIVSGLILLTLLALFVLSSTPVVERITTMTRQETELTLAARLSFWHGAIRMIAANPLLGVGPGGFTEAYPMFEPPGFPVSLDYVHNDYLQFAAEYGLSGLAFLIWSVVVLFRSGARKLSHASRLVRGIAMGALSGLVALMVHSVSDFNLHRPVNAILA